MDLQMDYAFLSDWELPVDAIPKNCTSWCTRKLKRRRKVFLDELVDSHQLMATYGDKMPVLWISLTRDLWSSMICSNLLLWIWMVA